MAARKKRRRFGASTWQITERAYARQGRSPRRLHSCPVELRVLKAMTTRLAKQHSRGGTLDYRLVEAWEAANTGKCRVARKKLSRIIKSSRSFLSTRDRMQREGYTRVPGRDLAKILSDR
jgi:hypothetical protein